MAARICVNSGEGLTTEKERVTRLGIEPKTPGLKVPEEGVSPESD
jgi:hypothetical protein